MLVHYIAATLLLLKLQNYSTEEQMADSLLIMARHGQSAWNKKNLFTGWVDIPLSQEGVAEAEKVGRAISHLPIDMAFTSNLIRAIDTALIALSFHSSNKTALLVYPPSDLKSEYGKIYSDKATQEMLPIYRSWHLNERMYGQLQGLDKAETMEKFGKEQVQVWRRSFDVPPPGGESLEQTAQRTIPYFNEKILPLLKTGKNIFISAHGNSLRSIIMELDGLTKEEVVSLELPTGEIVAYRCSDGALKKCSLEDFIP